MMDQTDRDILNIIQSRFPIAARPYLAVAEELGLSEAEVLSRVQALKDKGIIRRIGGNASSKAVGYASTLCAANVPEAKIERFAASVNARPGVTHNYRREGEFNLWFTLIAPSKAELEAEIEALRAETGIEIISLPAVKTFKIQVDFEV